MRKKLADELARAIEEQPQSMAQTARDLGYSRQRLHQLKSGDRSASSEAIEEALDKLGYEVEEVKVRKKQ